MPAPPEAWPLTIVMPDTDAFAAMLSLELNSQPRFVPRQSCHVAAEPASEATLRDCSGTCVSPARKNVRTHSKQGSAPSQPCSVRSCLAQRSCRAAVG